MWASAIGVAVGAAIAVVAAIVGVAAVVGEQLIHEVR